ncbi:MAG: hypothetical protein HYT31_00830 [Parcubacteria group bacterium]|nr:hypothetical protein [Parcubacteria group bacterium]
MFFSRFSLKRSLSIAHPFLLAIFPFLFFWTNNPAELDFSNVIIPILMTLGITAIVLINAYLLLKNPHKAAVGTSLLLIFFFSYGYIYEALLEFSIGGVELGRARYVLPTYGIVFVTLTISVIVTRKRLRLLSEFLNVVAVALIAISLFSVIPGLFKEKTFVPHASVVNSVSVADSGAAASKPDIYYIILDAYGNEKTLRDYYNYDNSSFISALRNRGFYIPDKSTSNFAVTHVSLSSSLNMEYVNYLTDVVAGKDRNFDATGPLIENNKASQFLKSRGYSYVNFRSIWGPRRLNPYADANFQGGKFDELSMLIINTTLLRAGLLYPPIHAYVFSDYREQILYQFNQLAQMPEFTDVEGPKFLYAHIMAPHPPFLFGPNGEPVLDTPLQLAPENFGWSEDEKQRYINQVTFVNKKVLALVDQLLTKSETEPIIIIQGDHGPWSTAGEDRSTGRFYRERMRILNAYYMPGNGETNFYETITPVNTFRIIFNTYFDGDFDILKDRNYFSDSVSNHKTPFQFIEVTSDATDWSE